jgi:hypothetical protein
MVGLQLVEGHNQKDQSSPKEDKTQSPEPDIGILSEPLACEPVLPFPLLHPMNCVLWRALTKKIAITQSKPQHPWFCFVVISHLLLLPKKVGV